MRPMFLLLVLSAGSSASLPAQSVPVQAGDRVRIVAGSVSGSFSVVDVSADTLLLREGGAPQFRVPLAAVQEMARRDKRTGWQGALHGAGLGLLIGGVAGVITGFASGDDPETQWFAFTAEEKALALGIVLGGGGALLGGVIGAASPGERWVRLPLPAAPRVSHSSSNGLLFAYSIKL